jgi:nucleoside-diphosphate-sugar epimerase
MIIGSGDIASVLTDREDVIFFVSGVSNSKETRESEFEREKMLLYNTPKDKHLIYISTLSVYYQKTPYTEHKLEMERLISAYFPSFTIFRIGNITWGKNPNTFINYLKAHPDAERKPVWRYLVDKEEFLHWIDLAPIPGREIMNITGKMIWVPQWT